MPTSFMSTEKSSSFEAMDNSRDAKPQTEGLMVLSQGDVTFDRCWAPSLLLDNGLILRGRSQLIRVELSSLLPEGESKRSDIELTSMEAMYGEVPPATKRLLAELNAKSDVENVEAYKVYRDRNPQLLKKKFLSRILSEARKANLVETIRLIEADLNE